MFHQPLQDGLLVLDLIKVFSHQVLLKLLNNVCKEEVSCLKFPHIHRFYCIFGDSSQEIQHLLILVLKFSNYRLRIY